MDAREYPALNPLRHAPRIQADQAVAITPKPVEPAETYAHHARSEHRAAGYPNPDPASLLRMCPSHCGDGRTNLHPTTNPRQYCCPADDTKLYTRLSEHVFRGSY
jgi:hypothetical protein